MHRLSMTWRNAIVASLLLIAAPAARAEDKDAHGGPPIYEVDGHDAKGQDFNRTFDLSKPADLEALEELLKEGHVHELNRKEIPTLAKMGSLAADLGIWTLVVFGLLFFILQQKAWPMMLEGLTKREDRIRGGLAEAQKAREEAQAMREKFQQEIASANQHARAVIEQATRDAQKAGDEIKAKALADIQAEKDRARHELELARDAAVQQLWEQTAQLATQISAKVIGRNLSPDDHRHLADEAIADLRRAGTERQREVASV